MDNIANNENKDEVKLILKPDLSKTCSKYKVIIIGDSSVGKTSLFYRYRKRVFLRDLLSTIGFEYSEVEIQYKNCAIRLQYWDTCGQETYRALIKSYYKDAAAAIFTYAINDIQSFNHIDEWVREVKQLSSPSCLMFLVGNKSDLQENLRKVSKEQGELAKTNNNFDYFIETSAKIGDNVDLVFNTIGKMLIEKEIEAKNNNNQKIGDNFKMMLNSQQQETSNKSSCC